MFADTAFELISLNYPSRPKNILLCISFCAFVLCLYFIFYILYFIFVLAMFDILLQKRGENIATPSGYIFVFGNEVFDKINEGFRSPNIEGWQLTHWAPKHFLEKCFHLLPQNISLAHLRRKKKWTSGRQMISSIDTTYSGLQTLVCWKKSDVKPVVFLV